MSAIYILIGCSIPIAIGFLIVFLISAQRGQFDDDYTPSIRMLMDDEVVSSSEEKQTTASK
ncbi:MAG: cbb3-type cytochrome oxidase assembly protein CcoS [Flavobacteriales bacterium]|jgi:cbb3-type cytochrome oxidase maturation protein